METKITILIVDDLKDNRLSIKIALKKEGYILEEAVNGKKAVEKCKEIKPDIILMDAMMPVMDGYEATKAIRRIKDFDRISILMITALSDKNDIIKALEVGVNDFITKPFDKHELIARCRSYAKFSQINKQYILAIKNPSTNLPNKLALIRDIKECQNPKLILFTIQDYELLESFYSEEIARHIVKKFIQMIPSLLPEDYKDTSLYHINEAEFALLKDKVDDIVSIKKSYKNCEEFLENTKKCVISLDNYEYSITIVLSYVSDNEHILENARMGLNHAVNDKKDIVFADEIVDQVHKEAKNNIKTIKMIKTALKNNKVVSYFQPLYNNKTKKIEKYESLVRIIDENQAVISPFLFLDVSKKGKYYTHITKRVLQNSFEVLKKTDKDISINLSAIDIEDDVTKNFILDYCKNSQQFMHRVVFEFLEDENFKNLGDIVDFIQKVKGYGAKIAIDDFGSGYSSFERIMSFEPDILKIDGTLVKNIDKDNFSKTIVETIQNFAKKMDIKTVAEFVHSKEVFDIVNAIGIDYTQGYYIGEPKERIA